MAGTPEASAIKLWLCALCSMTRPNTGHWKLRSESCENAEQSQTPFLRSLIQLIQTGINHVVKEPLEPELTFLR
jgi:hypothetical protein